jgi:hypothetical protein
MVTPGICSIELERFSCHRLEKEVNEDNPDRAYDESCPENLLSEIFFGYQGPSLRKLRRVIKKNNHFDQSEYDPYQREAI